VAGRWSERRFWPWPEVILKLTKQRFFRLPSSGIGLACWSSFWEGAHVNSTLKIQTPEAITLIEKIKADLKKRAEAKAKRMWLRKPKRLARRWGLVDQLIGIAGLVEKRPQQPP
jgi:hypothetical protein